MTSRKISAYALAAAAAALFSTAPITAHAGDEAKVKCEGMNGCKGTSACATAKNECAGKNACKGQGYLNLTKAECDAAKEKAAKKS